MCLYSCSAQKQALLINHAVFRLGLQKEKQVNARVTNAVERAGENITLFLTFYSILFMPFLDVAISPLVYVIPIFSPPHLFANNE